MPGATKKAWTLFPTRQLCLIPQWIIQRVIWAWILFCHCFSNGTSLDSERCSKQQTHTTFVSHFESGENKKDPAALPHQSLCFQLLVWLARLGGARLVTTLIAFPSLWWFKFIFNVSGVSTVAQAQKTLMFDIFFICCRHDKLNQQNNIQFPWKLRHLLNVFRQPQQIITDCVQCMWNECKQHSK